MWDPAHAWRMHPAWTVRRMDLRPGRSRQARRCPRPRYVLGFAGAAYARQIRAAVRSRPTWKARPVKYCRGLGGILPAVIATGAADPHAHPPGHNISSADTPEARLRRFFPNRTAHAAHMLAPKRPGGFTPGPVPQTATSPPRDQLGGVCNAVHHSGRACQRRPIPPYRRRVHAQFAPGPWRVTFAQPQGARRGSGFAHALAEPALPVSRPARRRGAISFVTLWVWRAASCARPPPSPRSSLR